MYAAAGVSHSIFVDSTGRAYTCGKGKGLLGHGDNRIRTVPTLVESLEVKLNTLIAAVDRSSTSTCVKYCRLLTLHMQGVKIVRAAAGVARSIFISSDGFGYWCGEGMGELKNVSFECKYTSPRLTDCPPCTLTILFHTT